MTATFASPSHAKRARGPQFSLRTLLIVTTLAAAFFAVVAALGWVIAAIVVMMFFLVSSTALLFIRPHPKWERICEVAVVIATVVIVLLILLPPVSSSYSVENHCRNNLSQLGVALLMYHEDHGTFPPAHVADDQDRPLHSWRVLVLPYLECHAIHARYDFAERWDGPTNCKLHTEIVHPFQCMADCETSDDSSRPKMDTSYVAVVGPRTMWPGDKALSLRDIKDEPSETILLVEIAGSGIPWIEPRDLHVLQMAPAVNPRHGQGISSRHPRGALVLMADRSIRRLSEDITPEQLRALLSPAGGETIDPKVFADH